MQSEGSGQAVASSGSSEKTKRVIKRYSNRKLYDTRDSRYVTLQQIGEMVRAGEEVQIIDNKTKEDKTEVTLALILSEDLRAQPRSVPLGALRDLIQERGGKWLTSLREGPIGRLIPGGAAADASPPAPEESAAPPPPPEEKSAPPESKTEKPADKAAKNRLTEIVESSFSTIDERIRAILPGLNAFKEQNDAYKALEAEVARLNARVESLEATVTALSRSKNSADKVSK
ncbi:MAG: polyhydroxyalkanoate synthesis regulator DNA-binding domain-containing protein [Polyangiaceae bacterium]